MKFLFVVSFSLCCSPAAYAALWTVDFTLKQDLAYDDNVRMSQVPQGSLEYKLIPTLNFTHKTENSQIQANASYGIQRYPNIKGFDRSLQNYAIQGNYSTERSLWGLSANLNIAPNRNTAIQDSGNFTSNSNRTSQSITPFVSYRITELDNVKISLNDTKTTYSTTDFSNSQTQNVDLNWQRQWTERYSSSISTSYSNYQFGGQTTSDSYNINLSMDYLFSEKLTLSGTVGGRFTQSENQFALQTVNSQSTGLLFNTAISYKDQNLSSVLALSRSLMPSSLGQLQEQSTLNLNLTYHITERLSAGLSTSYQQSILLDNSSQLTRENIVIQPSIHWKVSSDWTLSGSYRYRNQSVNSSMQDISADSNLFMLSINYNWQGLNFSR
jgi:hypothetical protein